jgi:hypothetical protein
MGFGYHPIMSANGEVLLLLSMKNKSALLMELSLVSKTWELP